MKRMGISVGDMTRLGANLLDLHLEEVYDVCEGGPLAGCLIPTCLDQSHYVRVYGLEVALACFVIVQESTC